MIRLILDNCLSQIFDIISLRQAKIELRELIFYDDNVRAHQAWITIEFFTKNRTPMLRIHLI